MAYKYSSVDKNYGFDIELSPSEIRKDFLFLLGNMKEGDYIGIYDAKLSNFLALHLKKAVFSLPFSYKSVKNELPKLYRKFYFRLFYKGYIEELKIIRL